MLKILSLIISVLWGIICILRIIFMFSESEDAKDMRAEILQSSIYLIVEIVFIFVFVVL